MRNSPDDFYNASFNECTALNTSFHPFDQFGLLVVCGGDKLVVIHIFVHDCVCAQNAPKTPIPLTLHAIHRRNAIVIQTRAHFTTPPAAGTRDIIIVDDDGDDG